MTENRVCCFCLLTYSNSRLPVELTCCGFLLCKSCYHKKLFSENGFCWNSECHLKPNLKEFGINKDERLLRHEHGGLIRGDLVPNDLNASNYSEDSDDYNSSGEERERRGDLLPDEMNDSIIISDDSDDSNYSEEFNESDDSNDSEDSNYSEDSDYFEDSSDSDDSNNSDSIEDEKDERETSDIVRSFKQDHSSILDYEATIKSMSKLQVEVRVKKTRVPFFSQVKNDATTNDESVGETNNVMVKDESNEFLVANCEDADDKITQDVLYSVRAKNELDLTCPVCSGECKNIPAFRAHMLNHYKHRIDHRLPSFPPYLCPERNCMQPLFPSFPNLRRHYAWRHDKIFQYAPELRKITALFRQRQRPCDESLFNKRRKSTASNPPQVFIDQDEGLILDVEAKKTKRKCWVTKTRQAMTKKEKEHSLVKKVCLFKKYMRLSKRLQSLKSTGSTRKNQNNHSLNEEKKEDRVKHVYIYVPLPSRGIASHLGNTKRIEILPAQIDIDDDDNLHGKSDDKSPGFSFQDLKQEADGKYAVLDVENADPFPAEEDMEVENKVLGESCKILNDDNEGNDSHVEENCASRGAKMTNCCSESSKEAGEHFGAKIPKMNLGVNSCPENGTLLTTNEELKCKKENEEIDSEDEVDCYSKHVAENETAPLLPTNRIASAYHVKVEKNFDGKIKVKVEEEEEETHFSNLSSSSDSVPYEFEPESSKVSKMKVGDNIENDVNELKLEELKNRYLNKMEVGYNIENVLEEFKLELKNRYQSIILSKNQSFDNTQRKLEPESFKNGIDDCIKKSMTNQLEDEKENIHEVRLNNEDKRDSVDLDPPQLSTISNSLENVNTSKDCSCRRNTSTYHDLTLCPVCKSYKVTPIAISAEDGFLVIEISDDTNDLNDYSHIKFISRDEWMFENTVSQIVHYKSKKYVLLSAHPDISIDDVRRIYEDNGLGCVQKWLGVSMDKKRKIRFVETKAKDDGSFEFKCEIDRKVETITPIHSLTDVIEDLSVSNPNRIVSLHRGRCTVKCRKADRKSDFKPVKGMIIGYLSTIDDTRNQNKTISLLKKSLVPLIDSNKSSSVASESLPQNLKRTATKRKLDDREKDTNLVDFHIKKTKTKPSILWSTNRTPKPEKKAMFLYSGCEYKILDDV